MVRWRTWRFKISDQTESERPRKRTRTVQTTLGFDAKREDDHIFLSNVLAFLATSKDLSRTRQVCHAFRKCSDQIISARTTALIGGGIRPMIGQSAAGLLHAAEQADDVTRNALKEWNAEESRKDGFDLGLPTKKEENPCFQEKLSWHILAKIPCDPLAPGASVPVRLRLNARLVVSSVGDTGTLARLPKGFFHVNAYSNGRFCLDGVAPEVASERTLNDTLCRIKRDLFRRYPDWPCCIKPYHFCGHDPRDKFGSLSVYDEYVALCMNVYSGYQLGHPIPKLDLFHKHVETKLNMERLKGDTYYYL